MITRSERNTARGVSIVGNVLGIIFLFAFIVTYMRITFSGSQLTFESILQRLSEVKAIPMPKMYQLDIPGNWGVLSFIKDFLVSIGSIFSFAVFFSISAANAVLMLAQILPLLFAL